jgi:hypothetical protein
MFSLFPAFKEVFLSFDTPTYPQDCYCIDCVPTALVMLGQVKPGEEVETQGRISALLASGLASWRGSENQEPSSPLDQVGQGHFNFLRHD